MLNYLRRFWPRSSPSFSRVYASVEQARWVVQAASEAGDSDLASRFERAMNSASKDDVQVDLSLAQGQLLIANLLALAESKRIEAQQIDWDISDPTAFSRYDSDSHRGLRKKQFELEREAREIKFFAEAVFLM